ncbi:MAG: polysaccharide biosynthesis C-terminal domain-containing protein, partial [Trichormus sp.]
GEYAKLKHNIFKVVQFTYYIMLATSLIAYLLFPLFIQIFIDNPIFNNSYLPFSILLLGLLISSGYLPLDMFLIQAGFPGYQTFIKVIILLSNIILNSIFIPSLGIVGAAIATSLSFVFSVFLLKTIVKKKIGITI